MSHKRHFVYVNNLDVCQHIVLEGTHKLVPISLLKGETEWRRCKPARIWFEVTVDASGAKTIVAHPVIDVEVSDFKVISGCHPGQRLTVAFNATNKGDNFEGAFYLFVGTESNLGDNNNYYYSKIKAGNKKHCLLTLYNGLDEGTYTLRLATDRDGTNVLATTTATIKQSLRATDFDTPGFRLATSVQRVNVTVENSGGEYIYPLYLFASKTTDKGTVAYATGTAIRENSSEQVLFYFQPKEAGTWNLWVCTDEEGKNVIGQSTVEIIAAPTGEAKLEASALDIKAKVGDEGILFGSVTAQMIADAIKEELDLDIDRRRIDVRQAIKVVGEHVVEVSLYREIKAAVKLNVIDEAAVAAPVVEEAVEAEAAEETEEAAAEVSEESANEE